MSELKSYVRSLSLRQVEEQACAALGPRVGLSWAPLISGLAGKPTSTRAEASLSEFRVIHTYHTSAFSTSCSASFVGSTAAPSHAAFTAGR